MLSGGAFNALLKTLEEPPEHVKFILATTEPQKLPATILSRCQRFDFKKVSKEILSDYLEKLAKDSKIEISKEALDLISVLGGGSVRDSISILESAKSLDGKIEEKDIRNIIGIPDSKLIIEILVNILKGDDGRAVNIAKQIIDDGKESKILIEEMINIMEMVFTKDKDKILKYSDNEKNKIKIIMENSDTNKYYILKKFLELENNLKWSENKNIIFLASIIDLSNFFKKEQEEKENQIKPDEILNILKSDENKKETEEIIETKENKEEKPFNKIVIQKALQKLGEMQIFVFITNSDIFISGDNLIIKKRENVDINENLKNIAKDTKTVSILEKIVKDITQKKYNVEIKEW